MEAARSQDFTFVWLAVNPRELPLALSSLELRMSLSNAETFSCYVGGIVQSSPLLMFVVRAADIAEFFDSSRHHHRRLRRPPPRFAVCAMDDLWELNPSRCAAVRCGVDRYDPSDPTPLAASSSRSPTSLAPSTADTPSAPAAHRPPRSPVFC